MDRRSSLHGSSPASQSLSACVLHMDSVWLRASRVGPTRERFGTSLLCIACMYWDMFIMLSCMYSCVRMRDTRGCAPSRNVVEPAANAHILQYIPGAVPRNFVDAGRTSEERTNEFLLLKRARTRYDCKTAVKVLHLAVHTDCGLSLRLKAVNVSRYDIAY